MTKWELAAVEYLNTIPFLRAIEQSDLSDQIHINLDYPSRCAAMFKEGRVDLALVPVGALSDFEEYHLITNYCIGCDGRVGTVLLASNQPVEKVEKVILDYQSRTSVLLIQILLQKYWKVNPQIIKGSEGYENQIVGNTAAVIIGDRAFNLEEKFGYIYDLGYYWKKLTDLPFVFAVWVSKAKMAKAIEEQLHGIFRQGIQNIEQLNIQFPGLSSQQISEYFNNRISYEFDEDKRKALQIFLNYSNNLLTKNKSHGKNIENSSGQPGR